MPACATSPTPYAAAHAVLHLLLTGVQAILGDNLVALYVHGSLTGGDFDPERSDVDVAVVIAHELPDELVPALAAMHARIAASGLPWATKLDGAYIPQHALRSAGSVDARFLCFGKDGSLTGEQFGSDWLVQRHSIREKGVAVAGPAPQTLIAPLPPDDLRRAALGVLHDWWSPPAFTPDHLSGSQDRAFWIITICRVLYTLHYGALASKPVAARWAQEALGEPWAPLIAQALTWRRGAEFDRLEETLAFIRYALARSQI